MAFANQKCARWLPALLVVLCFASPSYATVVAKSENDTREYATFVLDNELEVLLVSDPETDKAAAALDVFVGSGDDPPERQGLAHFLEHMLFLGTEKYPRADEYQSFIATHGGSHNAYTSFEHTNYFFDIDTDYLEPALDRFAQFFIAPLFTPDYVQRERNAVHSEYQSRREDDDLRLHQAMKRVANPKHPFAKFNVGSLETLADRDGSNIRDELIAFYSRNYSAHVMALAVLGKEPLPVLKQWVVEKFALIKNVKVKVKIKKRPPPEPLFEPGRLPARMDVIPLKDRRIMRMTFPIPGLANHYDSKPVDHIANLLGHEGKGSLFSLLKSKQWIDSLSAGARLDYRGGATFDVSMELTEEGLENVVAIGSHVFQYIRLIGRQGVTRWIFEEQSLLNELAFRFQESPEPIGYVRWLAHNLQVYPPREVLRGPYALRNYDPDLIRLFLTYLRADNVLLTVSARNLQADAVDPWFDTAYRVQPLDAGTLQRWRDEAIDPLLAIPAPNELLPKDLAVKPPKRPTAHPVRAKSTPGLQLWFQQDTTFRVPRADLFFSVRSASSNDTPEHAALTRLYVKLVNDQLNEFYYPAYLAGLTYELYKHSRGFSVRVSGYHDKQDVLVERIVAALVEPHITKENFALARDELARQLSNASREPPHRQALTEVPKLLLQPYWTEAQQLEVVGQLEVEDLRRFVKVLLQQIEVVALAHGNLYRKDALAFAEVLEGKLLDGATPTPTPRNQVVKLSNARQYVRRLDIDHPDSAIALYTQGADKRFETRALIALAAHVLSSPFYNDLRTEKQLGYIVYATAMPLLEVPGLAFVVESPTSGPSTLEGHVRGFLAAFAATVAALDDGQFDKQKDGLLTRILEEEKQLRARSERYWIEIDRENYDFDSHEQLAAALRRVTKQQFADFYRDFFLGEQRRLLLVRSTGSRHQGADAQGSSAGEFVEIDEPDAFKLQHGYFPRLGGST